MSNTPQFIIPKPNEKVFLYKKAEKHETQRDPFEAPLAQNERVFILDQSKGYDGIEYPMKGGQLIWYMDQPFPRKGFVYAEALQSLWFPKRILLGVLRTIATKPMIPFIILFGLMPKKIKG